MALTVPSRQGFASTVLEYRPLVFGVGRRTGYGAYDPSAEDSVNAAAGASDGNMWGRARGTNDANAGLAANPPMAVDSPTGSGAYDDAWLANANAGYTSAYNETMAAKGGGGGGKVVTTDKKTVVTPVVYKPPAPKPTTTTTAATDHTVYYIAAGVLVAVGIGGVLYFVLRKKKHRTNPHRRSNPRRRRSAHGRRR